MRVAISNIAWDVSEDNDVADILNKQNINAIDIAPGKYFANPVTATEKNIDNVKSWWLERGIEITGMQAILFGTKELNVFGDKEIQKRLLQHLQGVCRIAGRLGAQKIVFGSPKNRDRGKLTDIEVIEKSYHFFNKLGDIAKAHDVVICLEPNPRYYGANFMTDSAETAQVVKNVNNAAIKMQFDTGAIFINEENPEYILRQYSDLIGHIHISEPDLIPPGDGNAPHKQLGELLQKYLPNHVATIEMLATQQESHLTSIKRAMSMAIKNYRFSGSLS